MADESPNDKIIRYEVVVSRTVIVYAVDELTAKARALQVDGVAGRYTVWTCKESPAELEKHSPIVDVAPSRETQK